MNKYLRLIVASLFLMAATAAHAQEACSALMNFDRERLTGGEVVNLCKAYQGKVVLVVNTASKCGYTYQYDGLEKLYSEYQDRGLVVLGFPSNDFAGQEPGSAKQIASFCRLTYGVEFPMFAKSKVAQGTNDPLYKALAKASGEYPAWNFHKYLIGRDGKLVDSFPSRTEPLGDEIVNAVEALL